MDLQIAAVLWSGFAGSALLIGAAIGYYVAMPKSVSAGIMAFGVGVLISALAFNLMHEALHLGGLGPATLGFCLGALSYGGINAWLAARGARLRKRSGGSGGAASLAIAVGSLMDGLPEATAIGTSLLDGKGVALVTVLAIFVSNLPEGLSSAKGMRAEGRPASLVFAIWGGIAFACAVFGWLGYRVIGPLGEIYVALALAVAAGAIFVMVVETMIPEAIEEIHNWTGPIAGLGFILAFLASQAL